MSDTEANFEVSVRLTVPQLEALVKAAHCYELSDTDPERMSGVLDRAMGRLLHAQTVAEMKAKVRHGR